MATKQGKKGQRAHAPQWMAWEDSETLRSTRQGITVKGGGGGETGEDHSGLQSDPK